VFYAGEEYSDSPREGYNFPPIPAQTGGRENLSSGNSGNNGAALRSSTSCCVASTFSGRHVIRAAVLFMGMGRPFGMVGSIFSAFHCGRLESLICVFEKASKGRAGEFPVFDMLGLQLLLMSLQHTFKNISSRTNIHRDRIAILVHVLHILSIRESFAAFADALQR